MCLETVLFIIFYNSTNNSDCKDISKVCLILSLKGQNGKHIFFLCVLAVELFIQLECFGCELLSFADISCRAVCLLSNIS